MKFPANQLAHYVSPRLLTGCHVLLVHARKVVVRLIAHHVMLVPDLVVLAHHVVGEFAQIFKDVAARGYWCLFEYSPLLQPLQYLH